MKYLALTIEIIGVVLILSGLIVEIVLKSHVGFIAITGGSFFIALGGLIWAKLIPSNKR